MSTGGKLNHAEVYKTLMKVNLLLVMVILVSLAIGYFWPETGENSLYPVPKVKIYVPSKPGGTTDATARAFARALERNSGVKAVVINQTAGGGTVAVASVASARSDGATLLVFHAMLHVSHDTGRMDTGASDLTPLATISRSTDVYVARAESPFDSLQELFAHAPEQELLIASQMGGTTQLKASVLATAGYHNGVNLRPVAIGSMAKRLTALLGGQVDVSIVDLKTARQYLDAGTMKPLAVISDHRDPFEPEWPTALEQGVDIDLAQVSEVYAPGNMTGAMRARLNAVFKTVLQDPELTRELQRAGQTPEFRDSDDARFFIEAEAARVSRLLETRS